MPRQIKGVLFYLSTDIRYALSIFWMILGGFLLLSIIVDQIIGGKHTTVEFNLSAPIYVFAGVAGFLTVKSTLPYLIKMGATRKHLFIGTVIYFFGLALFNTVVSNVLDVIASSVTKSEVNGGIVIVDGESSFNLHHLADVLEGSTWITRLVIDTSISFFLISVFFIVGLIFYRYGLIGGFSFIGILLFTLILGIANGWMIDFFATIFSNFSIVFFYQLVLVGFVIYLLSFLLLRRITI